MFIAEDDLTVWFSAEAKSAETKPTEVTQETKEERKQPHKPNPRPSSNDNKKDNQQKTPQKRELVYGKNTIKTKELR